MTSEEQHEAFLKALEQDRYDLSTHLAFADFLYEHGEDALAQWHAEWTLELQEGIDYLQGFAKDMGFPDEGDYSYLVGSGVSSYEDLITRTLEYLETGEPIGIGMTFDTRFDEEQEKFWEMFKRVTGKDVKETTQYASGLFKCCY